MIHWYVIQTKPKKEEDAKSYLLMNGLEVFNPLMENFVLRSGRVREELRPFFPGYIFGKFDIDQNYNLVRWGRGVKKVLGFGGHFIPISEEIIDQIKIRTDNNGIVRKNLDFGSNDPIRIKSGPLKDFMGIFDRWTSDGERVKILLNLIGYQPSIELHYSMLEKVA